MKTDPSDPETEKRLARLLLDVLIRAGLVLALVMLCYRVFSPFLVLMVWALILAVTLYPLHQALAARMGGRQGWAATLITVLGVALIVAPTAVLLSSMGDSVHRLIDDVQQNTLQIPPPRPGVAAWPVVGPKVHAAWQLAHDDLPALVKSLQPKIGELAKAALGMVASIGGGILAVRRGLHHRRHHHGLRRGRRSRQPRDLRAHRRRRARRRVHHAVGGDDPRRRPGRDRHRLHPGHPRRPVPARSPACRWPACWRSSCSCSASRRCRRCSSRCRRSPTSG